MKKTRLVLGLIALSFLSLTAFSADQQKSDKELPFFAQDKDGNRIDLYRESYALIIGIDHYTAGWPDLPGVAKDIEDVKKELMKQGFRITVAKNLDRDKLLSTVEGFISKYGHDPENRLLVYFAGHGHTIRLATQMEMGYIVPADAPNPNVNDQGFKDKAIDMYRFENFAQQIECKHALFIFDSCFSGSIFALSRGAVPEVISYKTARPVRQFITSGSADEMVPDKSVFKSQFVSGIEGEADTDKDGFVTGTELGEFLLKQVVNYSKGTQHPQYGKIRNPFLDKGDFVFIVRLPESKKVTPEPSFDIEQEFWKSTAKFDTAGAYEAYLKKYPSGLFSDLASERLRAIREAEKSKTQQSKPLEEKLLPRQETPQKKISSGETKTQASETKSPTTVKLIQLPAETIRMFNEKVKQLLVPGFPKDIKVQGQVNLTLSVGPEGNIIVEAVNDAGLNVTPPERRDSVRQTIITAVAAVVLDPPKDRRGKPVSVGNWQVSYSCGVFQGKLVLSSIVM